MPYYKDQQNKLHWLDSTRDEQYLPTSCILITDNEADLIRKEEQAAIKSSKTYAEKRAIEYPSFAEQFDLLYHSGFDVWKETIRAVKDRYPKRT